MISPDEAWNIIVRSSQPLAAAPLGLARIKGHILARPVCADRDLPPADKATRDGYAIVSEDADAPPVELKVVGEAAAGVAHSLVVGRGECAQIATGAILPAGADAVVMVEDTEPGEADTEGRVRVLKRAPKGSNVSQRGDVARRGEDLIAAGTRLGSLGVATCAAVGLGSVEVHRKPAVSILATGAELRDLDHEVRPHETRNSNGPMLASAVALRGFEVASVSFVTDEAQLISGYLQMALERSEVIVMTGGTSVGKYDLVAEAIDSAGGKLQFRGVAMSPGKPAMFAVTEGGQFILGLPGNPLSAMTGFHEFVLPLLRRLAGWPQERCRPAIKVSLTEDVEGSGDRERYVLGRLGAGESGTIVEVVTTAGAADLVAGSKADGTLIVPANAGMLRAGSVCDFRIWK